MSSMPLRSLLAALLLTGAVMAEAGELSGAALAREVSVRIDVVRMEITMMTYEETSKDYAQRARKEFESLTPLVLAAISELALRDVTAGEQATEHWQLMQDSLFGGGEIPQGILDSDYDATLHGYFGDGAQQLNELLLRLPSNGQPASAAEQAWVQAAHTISGYIQSAASPFGSYTGSFNSGEDADPSAQVSRVDAALVALRAKYRDDVAKTEIIHGIQVKWRFIRAAILLSGKKAMPNIVYLHGGAIVRGLKGLE